MPRTVRRRNATKKRTNGKSRLLEQCVDGLRLINFNSFTHREFRRVTDPPERYVVLGFPHESLYGTPGVKEALIVIHGMCPPFVTDDDGWTRIVMEAKWQEASGSVDEKLPYVWQSFLASPVRNWLLVMDGSYWREGRGKASRAWADSQIPPDGRTWHVMNGKEFNTHAKEWWRGA